MRGGGLLRQACCVNHNGFVPAGLLAVWPSGRLVGWSHLPQALPIPPVCPRPARLCIAGMEAEAAFLPPEHDSPGATLQRVPTPPCCTPTLAHTPVLLFRPH